MLAIDVLGPLTVSVDGRPLAVSAAKLRVLLVVLAMDAGSPVPVDRLVDALWGDDDLPNNARRTAELGLAAVDRHTGRLADAADHAREALALAARAGLRLLEGRAHSSLAAALRALDRPDRALDHAQRALRVHRETEYRLGEAHTLQPRRRRGPRPVGREHRRGKSVGRFPGSATPRNVTGHSGWGFNDDHRFHGFRRQQRCARCGTGW